jgi:hypothetical protein
MLVGLLFAFARSPLAAQTTTQNFSDSFHSTTLDRTHWTVGKIQAHGEAIPTQDGLRLTLTPRNVTPFFALNVWLTCRIQGDFDAQVSYRLVDWPYASGIRFGMGVHPSPLPFGSTSLHGLTGNASGLRTVISERASLKPQDGIRSGGEFYTAEVNGREGRLIPTVDRSGKLRVTRVHNEFTAYYWEAPTRVWIPTGQFSLNAQVGDDEWIAFQLWGYDESPNITVMVEDFSVSGQMLNCP